MESKRAKGTLNEEVADTKTGNKTGAKHIYRELVWTGLFLFILQGRLKFYTVIVRPPAPTLSVVHLALENGQPVTDRDVDNSVGTSDLTDQRSSGPEPDTAFRGSLVWQPWKPSTQV